MKHRDRNISIFVAFVSAVLLSSMIAFVTVQSEKADLHNSGEKILHIANEALEQRESFFVDLVAAQPTCSSSSLTALRRKLIDRRAILDVLILSKTNEVVCSAVAGLLPIALPLTGPSNATNRHLGRTTWPHTILPFLANDKVLHVVKAGSVAIVLSPSTLDATQSDFEWLLEIVEPKSELPVRKLYSSVGYGQNTALVQERVCSFNHADMCVNLTRSWAEVYAGHRWEFNVAPFFAVLFAGLSGLSYSRISQQRRGPAGRVLHAIKRRRDYFYCVYQPIVDLASGRVVGCEVLARHRDSEGAIPPSVFIPIIEKANLTWVFTEMMMTKLEADLTHLPKAAGFRISINFYPCDLTDRQLGILAGCRVLQRLRNTGVQLVCELLETGMNSDSHYMQAVQHLRETGVKIAVDDFGCGSSNISKLRLLQPDLIKIDKSFIDELSPEGGSIRSTFIPYMIDMALEIGAPIVAEGIETKYQADVLKALGVQYGQGYLFSRPINFEELSDLTKVSCFLTCSPETSSHFGQSVL